MSGHLTALAATAIGAVPVVSPRRRSRFEPSQDVGLPPEDTVSRVVASRPTPAAPVTASLRQPRSAPTSRADPAEVPVRRETPGSEIAAPDRRRPAEVPHPADERLSGRRPQARDALPPEPVLRAAPQPATDPGPVPPGPDEPGTALPVTARPARRERAAVPPPAPEVGVLVPQPLPTTAPAPVAAAPAAVRGSAPPPAEPDVRVTIGRLEVRSAPDPRSPEPSRRAPAGLRSLEEYGATRGGGRR